MVNGLEFCLYWMVDDWWYIFEVMDRFLAQFYSEEVRVIGRHQVVVVDGAVV